MRLEYKMGSNVKNRDLLKIYPFYIKEIKRNKKKKKRKTKKITKKPKELTNKQLSDVLPFPPEKSKKPKRLTKYQILSNILPFYDTAGISTKEHAFRRYAETYNIKVMDSKSLADSLFFSKKQY